MAMGSFRKLIILTSMTAVSIMLTLGGVELSVRTWRLFNPLPLSLLEQKIRGNIPALHARFYFDPQLLDDHLTNFFWFTPPGTRVILPGNVCRRYVSTDQNRRVTSFVPDHYQKTIFMMGGSTMFAQEVPDPLTISSFLQYLINRRTDLKIKVENHGSPGIMLFQQNQILEMQLSRIRPNDIVVFYDGANDIIQHIYFNNPQGIAVKHDEYLASLDLIKKLGNWIPWLAKSAVFMNLQFMRELHPPAHLTNPQKMDEILKRFVATQADELRKAERMIKSRGAKFFHFNQPFIFTKAFRTKSEEAIINNPRITSVGMGDAMTQGAQARSVVLIQMRKDGLNTTDLQGSFDKVGEDLFIDWVHINDVGNAKIATDIFSSLFENEKSQKSSNIKLDPKEVLMENLRSINESGRLISTISISSEAPEWRLAFPVKSADGRRWINGKNQAYFDTSSFLNVDETHAVQFQMDLHLSKRESTVIHELVWYRGTEEIERQTASYKNWMSESYKVQTPLYSIPHDADRMLVILHPTDGELTLPDIQINWLY